MADACKVVRNVGQVLVSGNMEVLHAYGKYSSGLVRDMPSVYWSVSRQCIDKFLCILLFL